MDNVHYPSDSRQEMARQEAPEPADTHRPAWFEAFLADHGTRKPSEHTMKAYRQDIEAIAAFIVGNDEPSGAFPLNESNQF